MDPAAAEQWVAGLDLMGMRFGLERMHALMRELGAPCAGLPAVHVVGTNGKTSVTRMTAAILSASGLRTGAYTSPHLLGWRERIALDGVPIPPEQFAAAATRVHDAQHAVPGERITQFEALTAIALAAFDAAGADAIVVEAGLGGRLDATNVIGADVVALAAVDLDHTDLLGEDIASIAGEKLGVAPEGFTGLVVGEQAPASAPGVGAAMAARGMSGWRVGQEIAVEAGNRDAMTIRTPNGALRVDADMPARWQRANLALAVGAAERTLGRGVDLPALMRALGAIENPGRLQVVPGAPVVVLDGAHNPAGARALADALPLLLGDVRPIAVMGMMADKDAPGILDPLAPLIDRVCVTRASTGRAVRPELLAGMLRDRGVDAEVIPGPARALQRARALAGPEGTVLVAGSLHLLADLAPVALGQSGTLAAAPGPDAPLADVWRLDDFRK
ncbi:MAG: bifunctional folylpolyglutamate synthase/dihydrofolate synthase [Miltoncostaeaceae bacterium]